MRHFGYLSSLERTRLFFREPQEFSVHDEPQRLATALGATLYAPASRPSLAADIIRRTAEGLTSAVICLEDSIADDDLVAAEQNAVEQLLLLAASPATRPLLFVRVRTPEHIRLISKSLGDHLGVITGFVLPKFTAACGAGFFEALDEASEIAGRQLLVMPVLESPQIIHAESRISELLAIRDLLADHRYAVLALRLGATDFSASYGLRRARDLTVYDVRVLSDVISDVVNLFCRSDGSGYVVTGPVWEYFTGAERMFKTQLRESPFIEHAERGLRAELLAKDLDGLIREVVLDKANGLTGKTVIHPNHVAAVHALLVVTHEEYSDALDVIGTGAHGGVSASVYRNKMNEAKPHTAWAHRIQARAEAFGVARESTSFVDLLGAGLHQ